MTVATMRERLARSLYEAWSFSAEMRVRLSDPRHVAGVGPKWEDLPEGCRNDWMVAACAGLDTLMTPSPLMLHECKKSMSPGRRPTPERVSVTKKHTIRWQAMVRAAKEGK